MRAILVDPVEKVIKEIDVKQPNKSLKEFYDIIGCDLVEHVDLDRFITMVIDEEGRIKEIKGAFKFFGTDLVIAGKAVIIGMDKNYRYAKLEEDIETFKKIIEWIEPADVPDPKIKILTF